MSRQPAPTGYNKFLSTLSLRRATLYIDRTAKAVIFLSTLSLRRATYLGAGESRNVCHFYPRSPCGERQTKTKANENRYKFLSTLSLRRATELAWFFCGGASDFYPRSPCGERQVGQNRLRQKLAISIHALLAESDVFDPVKLAGPMLFLSTLSLRRATSAKSTPEEAKRYFYPRSPCGERQTATRILGFNPIISIHALLAESDSKSAQNSGALLRI